MRSARKKTNRWREKLQGFTLTVALQSEDRQNREPDEDKDKKKGEKWSGKETRYSLTEDLTFKILDHLFKEKSVTEVVKLGPREEMFGLTPLCMAAALGHLDGVKRLLEAGARVDDQSNDGTTALMNAIQCRHPHVLDLLLQHGASVSTADNDGNNSLMLAMKQGDMSVVSSLWTHAHDLDINHTNKLGQTALHLAAIKGDKSTAECLLDAGANMLIEDKRRAEKVFSERRDSEDKMRQLLEQEERDKTRKERKREKKRQQRLKQKIKARAGEADSEVGGQEASKGDSDTITRVTSLDELDDIPLTVGPDGRRDIPAYAAAAATILTPTHQDFQVEEEWMMVGGKRSYPVRLRHLAGEVGGDSNKETSLGRHLHTSSESGTSQSRDLFRPKPPEEHTDVNEGCSADVRSCGRGFVRWADVARLGSTSFNLDPAKLSPVPSANPGDRPLTCSRRELSKEEFPTLGKELQEEFPTLGKEIQDDIDKGHCYAHRGATEDCVQSLQQIPQNSSRTTWSEQCAGAQPGDEQKYGAERPTDLPFTPEGLSHLLASISKQGSGCIDPKLLYEKLSQWLLRPVKSQEAFASVQQQLSHDPLGLNKTKATPASGEKVSFAHAPQSLHQGDSKLGGDDKKGGKQGEPGNGCQQEKWPLDSSVAALSQHKALRFKPEEKSFAATCGFRPAWMEQESCVAPVSKTSRDEGSSGRDKRSASTSLKQHTSHPGEKAGPWYQPCEGQGLKVSGAGLTCRMDMDHVDSCEYLWPKSISGSSHQSPFSLEPNDGCGRKLSAAANHARRCDIASCQMHVLHREESGWPCPLLCPDLLCRPELSASDATHLLPQKTTKPRETRSTSSSSITASHSSEFLSEVRAAELRSYLDVFFKQNSKPGGGIKVGTKDAWGKADSEFQSDYHSNQTALEYFDCKQPEVLRDGRCMMVSIPRLSDSDSAQTSPNEKLSETHSCRRPSPTPMPSSSSMSHVDSLARSSPSHSRSSSSVGIHECLAPGFLRAASGESQTRSLESCKDADDGATLFHNIYGNVGLLQMGESQPTTTPGDAAESLYPDLSMIPEKEVPETPVSPQPTWSRVVGHGRPLKTRCAGEPLPEDKDGEPPFFDWTTLIGTDYVPPSHVPDKPLTHTGYASGQLVCVDTSLRDEVLFPESLRDDEEASQPSATDVFPSIHDMSERDLFQDVFSNSYFLEQIAIDQIRRRLRSLGGVDLLDRSVLHHDLDYFASVYGVRLRDVLGPHEDPAAKKMAASQRAARKREREDGVPEWKVVVRELGRRAETGTDGDALLGEDADDGEEGQDAANWPWHSVKVPLPHIVSATDSQEDTAWDQGGGGSRRWRAWLRQILNMPWTMRRQHGKIVLPARSMEYNISRTGSYPLILGFLTDGTEVGVLALDRTRHALDTRLMATVAADSEPDVHFVLRYKAVWESAGRVYLAMELCDYTLDEYVSIVRLDHRQDPLSANRLAWQMLKGLKYLHANFAVPHGSLMPGWIFVDCDGRLRLAGYGLRDVSASSAALGRDWLDKASTLAGDARFWKSTDHVTGLALEPTFKADIQVAGMLLYYILTGGRHPFGDTATEVENNLRRGAPRPSRVSHEADHLVSSMLTSDADARPSVDVCLKHPFFWSGEKRFRLVLIVGSDILTEMKTGSPVGKEVLDDPCKYFQARFPALFMAVYRAMRASDRTDRTCYKPFF
ncbi:hypothetical protein C0Q70_18505 [Pomacea canaliculata]|uniref:Protein kinase domain-containing protein n=1 Tax=Pomacea canaliculata TaxID=400727 RepID=A0A2T7NGQ4_POMCA|nr:hypothetical protein C0Q70_18505 [Pomacea canaliculata]